MFFRKKKRLLDTAFFKGFTDYHSHILFGVDDGVNELSESLDILAFYELCGVKRIFLTPHINLMYNNLTLIETNFNILKNSYTGGIELNLSGEYLLDSGFNNHRELGLKCLDGKSVLVESSYINKSANFDEMLYEIACDGYTPVIAHPERYLFMNTSMYHKLKNCDYKLQLNLLSLSGQYGSHVMKRALYLLENNMYDYIGTDIHNLKMFKAKLQDMKLTSKQVEMITRISRM